MNLCFNNFSNFQQLVQKNDVCNRVEYDEVYIVDMNSSVGTTI